MMKIKPEIFWDLINCFAFLCLLHIICHYLLHFLSFSPFPSFLTFTFFRDIVFPLSDLFLLHYISFLPSFFPFFLPSFHLSLFHSLFLPLYRKKLPCFLVLPFCGLFFFLDAFAKLCKATIRFVMSVRLFVRPSAWNNSAPTEKVFMKFVIWIFYVNRKKRIQFFIEIWQK